MNKKKAKQTIKKQKIPEQHSRQSLSLKLVLFSLSFISNAGAKYCGSSIGFALLT
jgi:hypothetical protein